MNLPIVFVAVEFSNVCLIGASGKLRKSGAMHDPGQFCCDPEFSINSNLMDEGKNTFIIQFERNNWDMPATQCLGLHDAARMTSFEVLFGVNLVYVLTGPPAEGGKQECEPDAVETRSSSRDSPLSNIGTSTEEDQNQTPKEKKFNTTSVLVFRASAKTEWPAIAKRLGHKTRGHGENWRDYQKRALQNLGSDLLKGPKRHQEIARLAMDAGDIEEAGRIKSMEDRKRRYNHLGSGTSPSSRFMSTLHRRENTMHVHGQPRPNNAACRLCSVKFSRCDDTTPKCKRPVAKQPDPIDHRVGPAPSGKRKSRGEISQGTVTTSKKHKSSTENVIRVSSSSFFSTPNSLPSATTATKSVTALTSELWSQETNRYEARIQELQKQEHNSASLLTACRMEVQAAKQQSADFKAQNELLEAEIATLEAGNTKLEGRVGATRKALEGLKSKFLVKLIQAPDEIMTGLDEIGAQ
ncbi:hypothetical protein DFS33DRAFT_1277946 [Desarmillaria ectypa]|nr:hypothetical protein DFS33DRAFT_1277946 [Desarmillaria ectypa]